MKGKTKSRLVRASVLFTVFCVVLALATILMKPLSETNELKQAINSGEAVKGFGAEIRLQHDGSMTVTETILIHTEGIAFKRGFVRGRQTHFENKKGDLQTAEYEVKLVLRNNERINFYRQDVTQGVAFTIGEQDKLLEPGDYAYQFQYSVKGRMEVLNDYDLLRWDVSGFWAVPVWESLVLIYLPKEISTEAVVIRGYSGAAQEDGGLKDESEQGKVDSITVEKFPKESLIQVKSKNRLEPGQHLYIELGIPKGFIKPLAAK